MREELTTIGHIFGQVIKCCYVCGKPITEYDSVERDIVDLEATQKAKKPIAMSIRVCHECVKLTGWRPS